MTKKRLLAVEDVRLLEAIAVCLEQEGYEVMTARSGKEAFVRVAELVAESLSNKEIAHRLTVSIRTIESHVSHILAKKGFSNRVEIARYVGRQNA